VSDEFKRFIFRLLNPTNPENRPAIVFEGEEAKEIDILEDAWF